MDLRELETPCLLLDQGKLLNNLALLHQHLATLGVDLRPHGKTTKNIDSVRLACAGQSGGIAVSTLKEAEYYFKHGIEDVIYAVGIAPNKLARAASLIRQGAHLKIVLDSMEQATCVAAQAQAHQVNFSVMVEIDCDGHRSGVAPDDPLLLELGHFLHREPGIELAGILTHAGESYHCQSTAEIQTIAHQERDVAVACANTLRQNGLPCPIVSVGSTPTARFAENLEGVTEVRAGVFMTYDLVMANLGVCKIEDVALSVLTSVIGHQKQKGWIITDAGWMALSRDRGIASLKPDTGYGLVCDVAGKHLPSLHVSATNQEHGVITCRPGEAVDDTQFPVGRLLRILPNHACATAAMYDRYHVINNTNQVTDVWHRINGW